MVIGLATFFRNKKIAQISKIRLFIVRNFRKEAIPVTWEKPKQGWTKLNYDGSLKSKTGNASIGGVFRDHNAGFLLGYAECIGRASSSMAELAALRRGLELILENGWNDVWVEGDYKALVDVLVEGRTVRSLQEKKCVSHINAIIQELNNCVVTHIYREGNRAADKFAKLGHFLEKPQVWRDVPPHEVLPIVHEDAQGKIVLRRR